MKTKLIKKNILEGSGWPVLPDRERALVQGLQVTPNYVHTFSIFFRTKIDPECWDPANSTVAGWKKCVDDNAISVDYVRHNNESTISCKTSSRLVATLFTTTTATVAGPSFITLNRFVIAILKIGTVPII